MPSIGDSPRSSLESECSLRSPTASAITWELALGRNKEWASGKVVEDPDFFERLVNMQRPQWLWIGCADSRVPANELLGLGPGEVFVQRNVGNLASLKDINCMSCLDYAVNVLKVKHVIVCGHYGCGAVRAALSMPARTQGLLNLWLADIREVRNKNQGLLRSVEGEARVDRLVELNVMRQVLNVCSSPVVQNAWDRGQALAIHGLAYRVSDGVLQELVGPIMGLGDYEQYAQSQMDSLRSLSLSVLEGPSFERKALRLMLSTGSSWLQQEFSAMEATLELLYWSQNEVEYHRQLQEYYTLRAQHQQEQQRLNQVLFGHFLPQEVGCLGHQQKYGGHQQQQQQQQLAQFNQQLEQSNEVDMFMVSASSARPPLLPLVQANQQPGLVWEQQRQHKAAAMETCCTQLAGRKRTSEAGELLSTVKRVR
ncbi:hypothetical protein N2152v2_005719 [Parachlorella kessleri]